MMAGDTSDLKTAWRTLGDTGSPDGCAESERLWDGAHGKLESKETRELVEHLSHCSVCAETWRLAREMSLEAEMEDRDNIFTQPQFLGGGSLFRWLALAASVIVAVALGWRLLPERATDHVERGTRETVETVMVDGAALPRENFVLEWFPGPEGARYDLLVTTEDLAVVLERGFLAEPSFRIPKSDLTTFPSGTQLLWRVEMALPDGRHVGSSAFRVWIK